MPKTPMVTVEGWAGAYWLASASELERLVPRAPEVRYDDHHSIRWKLVADVGTEVLRAALAQLGGNCSPVEQRALDVEVKVTSAPLTSDEERIVASLFSHEAAVADHSSDQVTNGRHRMYYSWRAGAAHLPIQSTIASGWSDALFGDPGCTTLELQTLSCMYVFEFAGRCASWRNRPSADVAFIAGLDEALTVAERFLDGVAADAAIVNPAPAESSTVIA